MGNQDYSAINEYFTSVLGVKDVLMPEPSLNANQISPELSVEETKSAQEIDSTASASGSALHSAASQSNDELAGEEQFSIVKAERSRSEIISFVEMQSDQVSFFSNESGALLDKMITAMKVKRSNVSKIQISGELQDLRMLKDSGLVIYMGHPDEKVLGHTIAELRGQWLGCGLLTFHPSYLLENAEAKKHTWSDLQWVMKELAKQ